MINQNETIEPMEHHQLYLRVQKALKSNKLSKEDREALSYLYGSGLMFLAAANLLLEDAGM
jgi:hypothetical protein